MLVLSLGIFYINLPSVIFFPESDPDYVYVYVDLPLGTDIERTNNKMKAVETKIKNILLPYGDIIDAILVNIGENTSKPNTFSNDLHLIEQS